MRVLTPVMNYVSIHLISYESMTMKDDKPFIQMLQRAVGCCETVLRERLLLPELVSRTSQGH